MNIQGGCQNTPPYKEWLCTYHCIGRADSICPDKPISECMPRNKKENQFNRVGIYLYFLNCLRSAFWLWMNIILCLLCNYHCHCLFVFVGAVKIGSILSMVFCYLWLLCFSYSSTSTSVVIYQGAWESGSFLSFYFFLFILLIVVLFNCVQQEHELGYLSGSWRKWFLFEFLVFLIYIVDCCVFNCVQHEHECGFLSGSRRKWFLSEFLFFLIYIVDCCAFQLCAARARVWLFIWESEKVVPAQKYPRDTVDFEEQDIATRYFDIRTQS